MLNYQSLSFHDILTLRNLLGLKPAPEFAAWLEKMELYDSQHNRMREIAPGQTRLGQLVGAA